MNIKLLPPAWELLTGVNIIDRDGWTGAEDWATPITIDEFHDKSCASTVDKFMEKDEMRRIARLNIVSYV
jgi:hypothetical protein